MDQREARGEAAILARTVLSTCHESLCVRLDGLEHVSSGVVGLLAVGAQPYLVPSDRDRFFTTGTALSCRVSIPEVGVVRCSGTVGVARIAGDDAGVVRTLAEHHGCLLGPVDPAALQVVPLQLFGVSVSACSGGPALSLTPAEVAAARPDWVLARGRRLTQHLEQDHADDLVELAAGRGVRGASSVSLERLTTTSARLVCLSDDGVTRVDMVFDPPVRSPDELWRRLASAPAAG